MTAKKGTKRKAFSILLEDGTRDVTFHVFFDLDGKTQEKKFKTRAELFSWIRGADMFNVSPKSIVRIVSQTITIGKPS